MKTRYWLVSFAVLLGVATPGAAQVTAASCGGRQPVGYIGITSLDCDGCSLAAPGSEKEWSFRTEPRIGSLGRDSRAAGILKVGDVITHVNGKAITTREGAQEFRNIDAGESVVISVRRKGEPLKFAFSADSVCPNDVRLLGIPGRGPIATTSPAAPAARLTPSARPISPRVSFGMGLSCRGNCSIDVKNDGDKHIMKFSAPPEVYSIERGGPADKAGIRRGDVITHINDLRMDSEKGGEAFANAKPDQEVRFTLQRGNERRTVTVKAVSRYAPSSPNLAQSSESLLKAREALTLLQRDQADQMRKLQEELRRAERLDRERLEEVDREILRAEREREQLSELARELGRADGRMRAALADSMRNACPAPGATPAPGSGSSRTLRYSGTLGDSDIEVRGSNPVSVTETRDEVVITTTGTTVRVKKGK
ncbi:MAG: PDZ domain-containing protein [Gemmatimonadota bacterium]